MLLENILSQVHVVEAYQKLRHEQENDKNNYANMIDFFQNSDTNPIDISNLKTSNFSKYPKKKIDHLISATSEFWIKIFAYCLVIFTLIKISYQNKDEKKKTWENRD